MQAITSFAEAKEVLNRFIPHVHGRRGAYTLERMQALMTHLGDPQEKYKVIHVAGTSGKTSTAYYIASFLRASGIKTGLTISPYIDEINERVQIDMRALDEKEFCKLLSRFIGCVETSKQRPTYFEVLVAFAYWVFAEKKVEYAVIEVGFGGLLDGTNVIMNPGKLCVITDIGLDHTHILGKDLTEIAAQKAGIIKPYNTVFMYDQGDEVTNVVREVCSQEQADLHEVWPIANRELPKNLPLFQRRNWYLALSTYQYLCKESGWNEPTEQALAHTTETYIPARMEMITAGNKVVILDGAHNEQKLHALTRSLKHKFPKASFAALISMSHTKSSHAKNSIQVITGFAAHIIITAYTPLPNVASISPTKLAEHTHKLGYDKWVIIEDPVLAYEALIDRPEDVLVVTGSFFLLSELRKLITK